MEVLFSIGDIAIDKKENLKYRILSLLPQVIVLCQMDVDKLKIEKPCLRQKNYYSWKN